MTASGDARRVTRAVTELAPSLLAYFARRVDQPADAADLLSETLLALWKRARSLPADDDGVRPWMFGIARNVLMHHRRGRARQAALAERLRLEIEATDYTGASKGADFDDLRRALGALAERDREIVALVHWEDLSLVEVARVLRMKEGTVRSRYHRARLALRTALSAKESDMTANVVGRSQYRNVKIRSIGADADVV